MNLPALAIDPFEEGFLRDPSVHHGALRDAGPVVWLAPIQCYAMARHAEVSAALADHATYCSGRGVGLADFAQEAPWRPPSLLLETDPPQHDRTRGLMNKVVSLKALQALRPTWSARAHELVDRLVKRRRFDAVTDLGEVYPMLVFPDTVGLPEEGRACLPRYAAAVFNAFGPRNAIFDKGEADAADAPDWVANACRRDSLAKGSWGAAIHDAVAEAGCGEAEAERLVRSLLSAGIDTTVNGIAIMMLAFASFPGQWAKLRAEPKLARRALDESLRWDSTVQTFFRTTTQAVNVAGTTIPEGAKLLLFLAAANRDPRRWDNPERFDLGRATSGHVGFGHGIHQCLGQMVARLEAELLLEVLIPRVAEIRLTGAPVRRLNNTLHALASVPIEIVPA